MLPGYNSRAPRGASGGPERPGMAHLSLALLGPLHMALDDRPLTAFESDKVRALLIYLALEAGRPQGRATLAELFWPDQPDSAGRHNLRQALFNLRQALGDQTAQQPFLLISRNTVQFNGASDHVVDATDFGALIAACAAHRHRRLESCATCAGRLAAALELYRGDFLAQFSLADSAAFEEWSLLKRERYGQAVMHALTTLATYHQLRGDYARAAELAMQQLSLDPWREAAYRQLMAVLALDGQRTAALAAYERCCQVLADQLGVDPEAETTALYEQLRDADNELQPRSEPVALPGIRPHNLPVQLTPFVGREHELGRVGDLLADPQCRLTTILGPGGIGKTRLALQVALEQSDVFPDGVFWVPLAQLHQPELLWSAVADALGLALHGADEPATQLQRHLQEKELLLLLDNFEQLREAGTWLAQLLRDAPGVTLLVTSRERLELQGEWLVGLGGLDVPDDASAIERSGAGQLWLQTARRAYAGYSLSDDDRPCVARICRIVEGMPLAIELAAAWVRVLECHEIAAEIEHGLALLTTTLRDVPERHRSLRAVLDRSWQQLDATEQCILRQLSVFRGGFERDAAALVAGADVAQLAALIDKSLLRGSTPTARHRRFDLHELVRQYAFEQLAAAGETAQTRERHLHYVLDLAEQAAPHFTGAEERRWIARLDAEHGNLRAALEWATEQQAGDLAARICAAIWRFWHTRGYLTEGRRWIAGALESAGSSAAGHADGRRSDVDPLVRAHVLKGAGVLAWAQSDYAAARTAFDTALALYHNLSDTDGIAALSGNLGVLAMYQGEYEQATALLETSLALRREQGDTWSTAACLHNLGALAGKRGELARSRTYYEQALDLYRDVGHDRGIAIVLGNLADIAEIEGHLDRARRLAFESLDLLRKLDDTPGTARILTRVASLALLRNDVAQARAYYTESLRLMQAVGDQEYCAIGLEGFAAVAVAQERWQRAARLWGAAEALRAAIDVPLPPSMRVEHEPRLATARTHLDERDFDAAWAEGRGMSAEQAIAYALDTADTEHP